MCGQAWNAWGVADFSVAAGMAVPSAPMAALTRPGPQAPEVDQSEIASKNAVAESAFKKKFGNMKPNAGALLNRQRAHETRYFDSGDAFTQKAAGGAKKQEE